MKKSLKDLKVALVTDWLTNLGGAEKVLQSVAEIFPDAPIFTTVVNKSRIGDLALKDIRTSYLQKLHVRKFQLLLPFMPRAIESLDLSEYDLVISFSSSVAKGVLTTSGQTHVCYIHSPMRYLWEPFFDTRFKRVPFFLKPLVGGMLHRLRIWDSVTSSRPDVYIANSKTTYDRVKKYYRRGAEILYPPVDMSNFSLSAEKQDFYVCAGRMVHYKRFDLLVDTFKKMPTKRLVVIGDGSERASLERSAQEFSNIEFKDPVSDYELSCILGAARGLLFPQKEDAGIISLEAFASGTPVIAYRAGGALDVVREGVNGVFFDEQTPKALQNAIEDFEKKTWDPKKIRDSAVGYDVENFKKQFEGILEGAVLFHQ